MSREILAVDIDDVVAGTTEALRLYVNEVTGLSLTKQDYSVPATYWGYYETVWQAAGITDMSHIERFHERMASDQSNIYPVNGAVEVIPRLAERRDLVAVTSRELFMEDETRRWIKQYFGNIFQQVVLLGHVNSANQTKGDACVALGASDLLDDNIGHCDSAVAAGVSAELFGDYGWHHELNHSLTRCKDWFEVAAYFERVSHG